MLDWTIAKIDLIIVGLLLAKLFPVLTTAHRGWYFAGIVAAEIYFITTIQEIVKEYGILRGYTGRGQLEEAALLPF